MLCEWLAHSFTNIGDEYVPQPIYFSDEQAEHYANIYVNIDVKGCSKWCSGILNETSICFKYFNQFENCIVPYLNNNSVAINITNLKIEINQSGTLTRIDLTKDEVFYFRMWF